MPSRDRGSGYRRLILLASTLTMLQANEGRHLCYPSRINPGTTFRMFRKSIFDMKSTKIDIAARRSDFPSLQKTYNGLPLAYLDGPAGTQMPRQVIDAISAYYLNCNANTHGQFITAKESDQVIQGAREAVAALLGAPDATTVSFGANMTTLNYALSRAIGRLLEPGDEVIVTELDHEANRGPWLRLQDLGILVREVAVLKNASLDYDDFRAKANSRTKLIAMGLASNAFGTVNNFRIAREIASQYGAYLLVDAVHYAPHFSIDVGTIDADFLLCSAYKFYGPHVGILYARKGLLDRLDTDRLRTQDQHSPYRIETGTLNHAALAGVRAAVEYVGSLGTGSDLRTRLVDAMQQIGNHERTLGVRLHSGLTNTPGVTVHGQPFDAGQRAPTVSFTVEGKTATEVSAYLAERAICVWDGNFYAIRPMEVLGLQERGGVVRVGISLYTAPEDIHRLLEGVRDLANGGK
jgi:cysteine desulfurase family protein (TIGR01976 family)